MGKLKKTIQKTDHSFNMSRSSFARPFEERGNCWILDRSFDLFGVHMGLKYKDVANPLKGGNLHIKVDDVIIEGYTPEETHGSVTENFGSNGSRSVETGGSG